MKNWTNISLEQYLKIIKLGSQDLDEVERAFELVSIIFDCDATELPLNIFKDYLASIDISGKIPVVHPKKHYRVNGREYILDSEAVPTVAQFYDYENLMKRQAPLNELLVCLLLPKGVKYGDGKHNFKECSEDFLKLPIIDAMAIANFYTASLEILQEIFLQSLEKEIRMNEAWTKQEKRHRIKMLRQGMEKINLVSSQLSSLTAEKLILR